MQSIRDLNSILDEIENTDSGDIDSLTDIILQAADVLSIVDMYPLMAVVIRHTQPERIVQLTNEGVERESGTDDSVTVQVLTNTKTNYYQELAEYICDDNDYTMDYEFATSALLKVYPEIDNKRLYDYAVSVENEIVADLLRSRDEV